MEQSGFIRQGKNTKETPIIAAQTKRQAERSMANYCNEIYKKCKLIKPYDDEELKFAINNIPSALEP